MRVLRKVKEVFLKMPIYSFEGKRPQIAFSAYIAPTAIVIGNVTIGESCYIGHGAILRGDYGAIEIGDETAVEEGVIVHARPNNQTRIGRRVTIGHGAMIHNAVVCDGAVIGMRAVVSDDSKVGEGSIVGEAGLVKSKQVIPAGKVAVGVPVRVVGDVGEQHSRMTKSAKEIYVALARRYKDNGMVELPAHDVSTESSEALIPIGVIETPFKESTGTPVQGALAKSTLGTVQIFSAYAEGLADLDGFSHLVLLYGFSRSTGFELRVTPYLDKDKRGLFATRAPRRPNQIGMTVVRLISIEGSRLVIEGADMLDGTPLYDIKPSVPAFDSPSSQGEVRCGWLEPFLKKSDGENGAPVADDRFHGDSDSD
jgi:phenylacetic acid degradation protein